MAAGQQDVQQGNYENTERIFLMALHKAEEFGLEDRRKAMLVKGSMWRWNRCICRR